MRILVDTNVLVRFSHAGSIHQPVAASALKHLRRAQHELRTVPQILYEYWVVASRPVDRNGLGFSVENVDKQLQEIQLLFPPFRDERGILTLWRKLTLQCQAQGKQAHDARIVAAMQRHGVTHLLTFNVADFQRYPGIELIEPALVAAQ